SKGTVTCSRWPFLSGDLRDVRLAQPRCGFDECFQHSLEIERRAAKNFEHVRGGGLLLERLAQLIEQASVLDGDDRLVGETLHELDVLVGEGPHLLTVDADDAHQLLFLQHWYDQQSPSASKLGESALRVVRLHQQIVDMDNVLCPGEAAKGSFRMG